MLFLLLLTGFMRVSPQSHLMCDNPVDRDRVRTGDKCPVQKLAVSPDNKLLAVGCGEPEGQSTIRLFSMENLECIAILKDQTAPISGLQFVPTTSLLVSARGDKCIIWDTKTKEQCGELKGHSKSITSLSISLDGSTLATASLDKSIIIWDINRKRAISTISTNSIQQSLSFFPNRRYLISGSEDSHARIWDLERKLEVLKLKCGKSSVSCLNTSPDGFRVATACTNGTLKLWTINWRNYAGNDIATWELGKNAPVTVSMIKNGESVIVGSWGGQICIFSTDPDSVVAETKLNSHHYPVSTIAVSSDGKWFASGSELEADVWIWKNWPK